MSEPKDHPNVTLVKEHTEVYSKASKEQASKATPSKDFVYQLSKVVAAKESKVAQPPTSKK